MEKNDQQTTAPCHIIEETGTFQVKQLNLFYRLWRPKDTSQLKALVHINHGMSEHSARYEHFARSCAQQGFAVIAQDHPGHGQSVQDQSELGHIGDRNAWKLLSRGVQGAQDVAQQLFGHIPTILFGHSMGSFATLNALEQDFFSEKLRKHTLPLAGVILSGSTQNPWYLDKSLQIVARLERWRQGGQGRSKIIDHLTFKSFNRKFSPTRTTADWLSADPSAVDQYIADPLCGSQASNQTWYDFANGLLSIFHRRNLKKLPDVPYLLISGDQDPLSDHGGFHRLEQTLKSSGLHHIHTKTFPHGRHELLNEINRAEVEQFIAQWIAARLLSVPNPG